jgi:hypothetical protein
MTRRTRRWVPRWPRATKWLFGPLLALDVGLLLFALAFASVTAEGPAKRALGQSVAILTEVDTFLDEHYQSLQLEAQQTDDGTIALRDFPLAVTFSPQEIKDTNREQFRTLLLERSAALLHRDGTAAFRQDRNSEVNSLSPQGAVRAGLDLLRPTPHRVFTGLTIAFAALAAALTGALALSTRGAGRLTALGVSLLFASVPFLILAVALRFVLRVAADGADEYLAHEFLQLAQEQTWAPIRDGIIFSAASAALLAAGPIVARWSDRSTI